MVHSNLFSLKSLSTEGVLAVMAGFPDVTYRVVGTRGELSLRKLATTLSSIENGDDGLLVKAVESDEIASYVGENVYRFHNSLRFDSTLAFFEWLKEVQFELAAFQATKTSAQIEGQVTHLGIPELDDRLGLFIAFRGLGHDILCSRRVLDYGPFRVLRDEASDLTLIQCYDHEETDLDEVARQNDACRVYLNWCVFHRYEQHFIHDLRGAYVADKREVVILVTGREVSQDEMHEAAAMKYYRRDDPEEPVDAVVYQFMEEDNARKHLHDLWIRGLQCWILIDGQRIRIDEDYAPVHVKPDWVVRVEEREATSGD